MDSTAAGIADERQRIEQGLWDEPLTHPRAPATRTIAAAMSRHRVPGCAVAVLAEGQLRWSAGYGVTSSVASVARPVGADTIFQACSISKAVAAVAALRLVRDGLLDLDTDINEYLTVWRVPANGAWQPRVTLRHLLSHTAGLTNNWYPGYRRGAALPTTLQTLRGDAPANTPPVRVTALPGTQHRYSGSHYTVLQHLLSERTGKPFNDLMREVVFAPLGMLDSGYEIDWPQRCRGAIAGGHDAGGEPIDGDWREMPEGAAAGLWTTPADLCRLACDVIAAWSGGVAAVLDQETARQMLTPQVGGWGLGWATKGDGDSVMWGHGGSNIGFKCRLLFWPERGVGAAVMTNADDGTFVVDEVIAAIGREYRWPDIASAHDDAVYAGTQHDDAEFDGRFGGATGQPTIRAESPGDGLLLSIAGQPALPLRGVGPNRFVAEVIATEVVFERDADGAVGTLTLIQHGAALRLERRDD